jgi:hypothetical protein
MHQKTRVLCTATLNSRANTPPTTTQGVEKPPATMLDMANASHQATTMALVTQSAMPIARQNTGTSEQQLVMAATARQFGMPPPATMSGGARCTGKHPQRRAQEHGTMLTAHACDQPPTGAKSTPSRKTHPGTHHSSKGCTGDLGNRAMDGLKPGNHWQPRYGKCQAQKSTPQRCNAATMAIAPVPTPDATTTGVPHRLTTRAQNAPASCMST